MKTLTRHPAIILGLFSLLGISVVMLMQTHTSARIAANERAFLLHELEALIPPDRYDNALLDDTITLRDPHLDPSGELTIYRARKQGQAVAVIFSPVAPDGYNGPIRLLTAIGADGVLLGVRVISHHETPGLGDGIDIRKSDWVTRFTGLSLDDPPTSRWNVKRDGGDFDQFTGATITPRAVVNTTRQALAFFNAHRDKLFHVPDPMEEMR